MITKLVELIKFDEKIKIVDIGANPLLDHKSPTGKIGEEPSYKKLLDTEYAELIGFEPNESAYRDLLKKIITNSILGQKLNIINFFKFRPKCFEIY